MMDIGNEVDKYYKIREKKKVAQAKVDELTTELDAQGKLVVEAMQKVKTDKSGGKLATASIKPETVADVKDWKKFYGYIARNRAFDMLQKRVANGAYRERLAAGKKVPGLEPKKITKLTVTKRNS